MNQNRSAIHKSLPAGSAVTAVSKAASVKWKAMSEAEKKPFEAEYLLKKAKYAEDMKAYKEANGGDAAADDDGDGSEGEASPQKKQESPEKPKADAKKRGRPAKETAAPAKPAAPAKQAATASPPPAKKPRGVKDKDQKDDGPAIDAAVLAQAQKLNMETALRNLSKRAEMKTFSSEKLLKALQDSNGLVNKAKVALMGA